MLRLVCFEPKTVLRTCHSRTGFVIRRCSCSMHIIVVALKHKQCSLDCDVKCIVLLLLALTASGNCSSVYIDTRRIGARAEKRPMKVSYSPTFTAVSCSYRMLLSEFLELFRKGEGTYLTGAVAVQSVWPVNGRDVTQEPSDLPHSAQTVCGAHPASCTVGTEVSFPLGKTAGS